MDYADILGKKIAHDDRDIFGWNSTWEFPGFLLWMHPEYNCKIAATPWYNCDLDDPDGEHYIPIQVQGLDGDFIDGFDIDFPHRPSGGYHHLLGDLISRDIERYRASLMENWGDINTIIRNYLNPNKNPVWDDNQVQFVRLLAELQGFLTRDIIKETAESMDVEPKDINEILDRAVNEYEQIKAKICS